MPNRFQPIPPGTSGDQANSIVNRNFAELDNEGTKKLFYDENGIPSISIGVQQDKTSRIRISKPGIDVSTATDDQLAFNSSQNVLKVIDVIDTFFPAPPIATIPGGGGVAETSATNTIPHSYGFIPVLVAGSFDGSYGPIPRTLSGTFGTKAIYIVTITIEATVTDISITSRLTVHGDAGSITSSTGSVKIYVLQETATS
jgi:hypothetical protein